MKNMKHIIVIGENNDSNGSSLAKAINSVCMALNRDISIFITNDRGTREFSEDRGKLTSRVIHDTFSSFNNPNKAIRLTLIDTETPFRKAEPVPGLILWHQYYRLLNTNTPTYFINCEAILGSILDDTKKRLFWVGFVKPKNYKPSILSEARWDYFMSKLTHNE